jgi:TPR repeat protein
VINEVRAIWPNPEIIKKEVIVEEIQVKDDTHLREAHEMLFGFTRPQNVLKALDIYHEEVDKSNCHPAALNALGDIYETGKFAKRDMNKAVIYYKKSADKNDA